MDLLRVAVLIGALGVLGWAGGGMEPLVRPAGDRGAALEGAGWEGRRLLAQMLWLKTHAVLHAGAEEREAKPGEEASRGSEVHRHENSEPDHREHPDHDGHDDHEEHEGHETHAGEGHGHENAFVLVIPPKREDFRGFIGDLERSVKPYADANGKLFGKDPDQTVPFYRLMTWADPHFIQGYVVGANFLSQAGKLPDVGLTFLHEGERYNPGSPEIQTELGHYYLVYKHDFAAAEKHLRCALELLPKDRKLTEWETDAQSDAYRWLALAYRDSGRPGEAIAIAQQGLKAIGPDMTLSAVVKQRGRPPLR